jgi:hypothetical protein
MATFSLSFLDKLTGNTGRPKGTAGPRPWTVNDLKDLKALVAKGTPVRTLSLKLGRSESAIIAKMKEDGIRAGSA